MKSPDGSIMNCFLRKSAMVLPDIYLDLGIYDAIFRTDEGCCGFSPDVKFRVVL